MTGYYAEVPAWVLVASGMVWLLAIVGVVALVRAGVAFVRGR